MFKLSVDGSFRDLHARRPRLVDRAVLRDGARGLGDCETLLIRSQVADANGSRSAPELASSVSHVAIESAPVTRVAATTRREAPWRQAPAPRRSSANPPATWFDERDRRSAAFDRRWSSSMRIRRAGEPTAISRGALSAGLEPRREFTQYPPSGSETGRDLRLAGRAQRQASPRRNRPANKN